MLVTNASHYTHIHIHTASYLVPEDSRHGGLQSLPPDFLHSGPAGLHRELLLLLFSPLCTYLLVRVILVNQK